jgi:outer membrane lipoprotein-sorting protein
VWRTTLRVTLLAAVAGRWAPAAPAPTADAELEATLVRLREGLLELNAYEAVIRRTTEIRRGKATASAEVTIQLALERPNRVSSIYEAPEGRRGVVSDGERLVIWSQPLGEAMVRDAPETLAGILRESLGLAAEGLVIGGLFFSERPLEELTEEFDVVSDLGRMKIEGRVCRLLGLERPMGLRMVLWIDDETGVPRRATLDASATLRDWATALNVNSGGVRLTVTEAHTAVRINPEDLVFEARVPPGLRTVTQFTASGEETVRQDSP